MKRGRMLMAGLAATAAVAGGVAVASEAPAALDPDALKAAEALSEAIRWASDQVMPSVVEITTEFEAPAVEGPAARPEGSGDRGDGVRRPPVPRVVPRVPLRPQWRDGLGWGGQWPRGLNQIGTGIVVGADGFVLTCQHVVAGTRRITVRLADGRSLDATIQGSDERADLAVLKVDAADLPAATFADSDTLRLGQPVLAIGNRLGQGNSVTFGLVSGLHRRLETAAFGELLQTDAAMDPGSDGGPLVTLSGEVVGISTGVLRARGGDGGLGLVIPSNTVHDVLDDLIAGRKVARGYLGLGVQDLRPDVAGGYRFKSEGGPMVIDVLPRSPAEAAGFRPGDIVTEFNGHPIKAARDLSRFVAATRPGTEVKVHVQRYGADVELTVVLDEIR